MAHPYRFPFCPHCREQVVPDTQACPSCGRALDGLRKEGEGDELSLHPLSHSRWQKISLGLDSQGRLIGKATTGMFVAFVLTSWLFYLNTPDPTDTLVFVFSTIGLFSAYDVWAFTHGKPTSITIYGHYEAIPSNTIARVLGLLMDLAMMAACVWVLLSKL
ncbi:zinc ribbon domain-containing protein [Hydrogenophaga sp. A37]|uniref:zinc ribbon domain-containing protein n=1 Tax=Hydrogenophaga sp. A37 TaxID=1945864 RepID=UPI00117B1A8E|nr:zinc ribbon domain-containing protein [Hydrogenophaga sp. A37]